MDQSVREVWGIGQLYEIYIGRWSRPVASAFVTWLQVPAGREWADIGCGTGALTQAIVTHAQPHRVVALDQSAGFIEQARKNLEGAPVQFAIGDAQALPWGRASCDAAVSALVLNFVPDPLAMVREMARVTRPGGTVAAYVWDYADGMQMLRYFWDAVVAVNAQAARLDEGIRFPLCKPEPLLQLWERSGLAQVEVRAMDIPTVFRDFDDYWTPFLGGQGPAPTYLASLPRQQRERVRELLQTRLPRNADGTIALEARAWAVQGTA